MPAPPSSYRWVRVRWPGDEHPVRLGFNTPLTLDEVQALYPGCVVTPVPGTRGNARIQTRQWQRDAHPRRAHSDDGDDAYALPMRLLIDSDDDN